MRTSIVPVIPPHKPMLMNLERITAKIHLVLVEYIPAVHKNLSGRLACHERCYRVSRSIGESVGRAVIL